MKLQNKKTGEIHEITQVVFLHDMDKKFVIYSTTEGHNYAYKNLAELNEEWEDYEELKGYWYIGDGGEVYGFSDYYVGTEIEKTHREIGNLFETREEAEKAVEKLKAWKRLKDKGFKFDRWNNASSGLYKPIWFYFEKGTVLEDIKSDLDLLFGGEE